MNKNNLIIIGLVIVIIALLAGLGFSMLAPAKEDVKLTILSNDTINEGDSIEIKLTDVNDTPIAAQTVNIAVADENGACDNYSVVTNEEGIGGVALNKSSGNYTINCTFSGNENYSESIVSKKVAIEKIVEAQVSQGSSSTSTSSEYGSYINGEWVSMSEQEYAERYPALYHQRALSEGKYDQYHPSMYEVDRENGWI